MSKSSKDEGHAAEVVMEYLQKSNRPYSVGDIHNNLQKDHGFGKTMVQRVLENMAAEEEIKEKSWGKSKIYFIDQSKLPTISEEEVQEMDLKTTKLREAHGVFMKEIKEYESKLSGFKKEMTMNQITTEIEELTTEVGTLKRKLAEVRERSKNVDPDENIKVKKERQALVGEWRKRKRMAMNMLDNILEGGQIAKKALYDEIGIETEEDCGVTMPSQ